MKIILTIIAVSLTGCESAVQTAIRANEPPAVAYIVAPRENHAAAALPAVLMYEQARGRAFWNQ